MDHLDIAQLVMRCRASDALAVEALVHTYAPLVRRLALSILDDPAEADEAAQDSFVAAIDKLDSYRGDAAFTTWLYAITLNVCRGRLRKRQTRERLWQALYALFRVSGEASPHPEDAAIQNELERAVWKAINALDEKHRQPVILRYYHELPIAEIARVLRVSERTIHTRLHAAHERLRASLDGRVDCL